MQEHRHGARRARRTLAAGALAATAAAAAAGAQSPSTVVVRDPSGDVRAGGFDVVRAQLGRSGDARLRGVITLAADFTALDLLARSGPPGSLCLRLWTDRTVRPTAAPPTHLVCLTGQRGGAAFRASVVRLRRDGEPERMGEATVTRPSNRSVALRFPRALVGDPALVRWAADATRPGCARVSCTDTAPDAPRHVTLRLTAR